MITVMTLHYDVSGEDFTHAGEASGDIKQQLKALGFPAAFIRNVVIAVYEGEINMVIHANGGVIDAEIEPDAVRVTLKDHGPGIPDIEKAMEKGYSTAPDNIRALGFGAGMGLPNIKKYTDSMEIESEVGVGTTLYLTLTLSK